jgi:hypothetical protein
MATNQNRCSRCGLYKTNYDPNSLGSGRRAGCLCPRPTTRRQSARQTPAQNITYVPSTPTVAEQLVQLAKLYSAGALTDQEFQTLKTRLISGGTS